ncbi:MAG: SpoIIE family protein phosphatase [Planctomycetes bacterium]|nr:SpoIIE family protein phosphatase [Planctomycetota bacterium]
MSRREPDHLRLYREQPAAPLSSDDVPVALHDFCRAFERATGWSLNYAPGDAPNARRQVPRGMGEPDGAIALGHFTLGIPDSSPDESSYVEGAEPLVDLDVASALATTVARLTNELLCTQRELRRSRAELAAGVPLVARPSDEAHLADRLEAVLRGGAQAVGCTSAALYLLDEQTAQLDLRSVWNLPYSRLAKQARTLADATADLEALCGHAVVLENQQAVEHWCPPEKCGAAICVPVSSATTPLGTLWLYCDATRGFSDAEVNIAEVVAGRLAADLEREMLLVAGKEQSVSSRQINAASTRQQDSLPRMTPRVEGWDLAAWTGQAAALGGDFHDWWLRGDDRLCVAVADALDGGFDAALASAALRATLRAFGSEDLEPAELMRRINQSLWRHSSGDQYASLFCAAIEPTSGQCDFSAAGQIGSALLGPDGFERLTAPCLALGIDPTASYLPREFMMTPGQVLVAVSDGVCDATNPAGTPWTMKGVAEALGGKLELPAEKLVALVRDRLEAFCDGPAADDCTVLVLKRD